MAFFYIFFIIKKYSFNFFTTATSTTTLLPLFARYLKVLCAGGRRKRFLRLVLDLRDDSIEPSPSPPQFSPAQLFSSNARFTFYVNRVLHDSQYSLTSIDLEL